MNAPSPDIRWQSPGRPAGPNLLARVATGALIRENGADYLVSNARRYGDLVQFRILGRRVLQFNHPELIGDMLVRNERLHRRGGVMQRSKAILGEGLLTSEEPLHMRQRRLAQPAFHRARIAAYGEMIAAATAQTTASWQGKGETDVHADMLLLALRIVGRTLFSMDFGDDVHSIASAVEAFQTFLLLAFFPVPHLVERLPLPALRRIRAGRKHLDTLIFGLIAERRADPADRGDLLSMLLASVDAEGDGGKGMSDEQVRDECVTVLLAGHETTANALSFILWQLACHEEMQEELAAEAERVLNGRPPTADDYAQLTFTEQVVAEGLRLYPPVWVMGRTAAESYEYRGVQIQRGDFLLASQLAVHRDPRFWEEPLRFDPSRFTKERKASRPKLAYFPFGAGSRQCIGEGLAWMEAVLAVAAMVQGWRLRLPAGERRRLALEPSVTLRPKGPLRLRLERR